MGYLCTRAAIFNAYISESELTSSSTLHRYTGQRRDDTGVLFYNARYYDPAIGRFISADTVVPGNASGGMDGVALRPLTVAFHEPSFIATLNGEGANADKLHWGWPVNPQALNRYAYVMNNPMRWTDPTGHFGVTFYDHGGMFSLHLSHQEATAVWDFIQSNTPSKIAAIIGSFALVGIADGITVASIVSGLGMNSVPGLAVIAGLAQLGFTAAALVTVLTAVTVYGSVADDIYGNQGFDIFFGAGYSLILPPQVDQQQGIWFADHPFFSEAKKLCDSVESCAKRYADNSPVT